jgi:hypothetical protein
MRALHHIALGARDPASLAAWYRDVFDLVERTRHFEEDGQVRSVWLDLGAGAVLMVERTEASRPRVDGVGAGPFLLAFRIEASKRDAWEERLVQVGIPIEHRTAHTSYARDPEGNRVAVSHYPLGDLSST